MPLATKGGSIIVKDGKLAENCGCCGGWNCYQDCNTTICGDCGYTANMPSTLSATLTLSLNDTVYVPRTGTAFGGLREWNCYKITPEDATSASGTFSLSRESSTSCIYSTTIEGYKGEIRARVGASGANRLTLGSNLWSCASDCDSGLSLLSLARWIPCRGSVVSYGGAASIWRNAASLEYAYDTFAFIQGSTLRVSPGESGDSSVSSVINAGFQFVLAQERVTVTPCVTKPFDSIYSEWIFDLAYTDVTGSTAVVNRIVPGACTLTIEA
jgi:hypothetical protein